MAAEPIRQSCHCAFPKTGWLLLLFAAVGCQNTPTSIPSPFMADRVPPVPSRVPVTTPAQPYHQVAPVGAPVPAAQPTQPLGAALAPADDITPLPADPAVAMANSVAPTLGDEVAVQIPQDESDMRFAAVTPLPASSPAPAAPVSNAALQPTSIAPPTSTVALRQPNTLPPTAPNLSSWPPATDTSPVQNNAGGFAPPAAEAGLFRSPAPATLEVQPASTPRVRMPGASDRVREEVVANPINTMSHQVAFAGNGQGNVIVQPGTVAPAIYAAPPAPVSQPQDGFRPRGTFQEPNPPASIPVMQVMPR